MTTWQPIETAPKDGSEILFFWQGNGEDFDRINIVSWKRSGFVLQMDDHIGAYDGATHWAPLPARPEQTGET